MYRAATSKQKMMDTLTKLIYCKLASCRTNHCQAPGRHKGRRDRNERLIGEADCNIEDKDYCLRPTIARVIDL
ncbi:unnamed protein product [Arctia plantaginis]|uniref:Uncharacterized protein n=1 Tax=Arctia plantaginis TaxID=874455 RepID=A0A8S0YT67_ARCPL|nr:unnamed protein product [Arctia plantaginis]